VGIARIAKRYNKKVIVIAGKTGDNVEDLYNEGIDLIFSYYGNVKINLDYVKEHSVQMLKHTANLAKEILNSYPELKNKKFVFNETENLYNS
jgi:glycerate 2-kinase